MGTNKSLLLLNGKTLIERTAELMKSIFSRNLLVTNTNDEYRFLGLDMFNDIYNGFGPLSGIHSGLVNSKTKLNFIISCDIPLITSDVISFIACYESVSDIVIPEADGFVQHLCGRFNKTVIPSIESKIKNNIPNEKKCSIHEIIKMNNTEIIDSSIIHGYKEGMFFNLNSPSDYNYLKNISF